VQHKRVLTKINGLDYSKYALKYLNPIPPKRMQDSWAIDYQIMQEKLIYGDSLPFQRLLYKLTELKAKINQLGWAIDVKSEHFKMHKQM
jgi:hypothetical protein